MDEDEFENVRLKTLGFRPQREIVYNKLLPYAEQLDQESLKLYTDIKTNLAKSILLREIRPGCVLWTSRLNKYLKVYGLKFSKEDHIALIKLMYELITIPDLEPTRVNKFSSTLLFLLKKTELLSPEELQLPWRPLYNLCERIMNSSTSSWGMYRYIHSLENSLDYLVHAAKIYFPASSTQEMLDEWRPKLCPFDSATIAKAVEYFEWFLPVAVFPKEAHISYELWFHEFMNLWEVCHNAPIWEVDMLWLMAHLASYNTGYIDWEPYVPIMFTRFLRCLDLPVNYRQKASCKRHKVEITPIAIWIVSTIGGKSSTLKYLEKFLQTLESFYHSANHGRWASKLRELFRRISYQFVQRVHKERHQKRSWQTAVPETHQLTEGDIDTFVGIMKPIVVYAIYSRQGTADVSQALQHLATLRPAVIVPLVLDKIYATLDSLTEPHKLTAAMQCLVSVARPMVQGARNGYPEGPTHVIPLLLALLPGIDPNDLRKCFVTFQFVSTFILMVPLVDSSGAADHHADLTDEEHAICEASAGLQDFVLQFFDRIFNLIENSALENTRLEQADTDRRSKLESMADNALQSICNVIASQTSPPIFKAVLHRLFAFVRDHILEVKVSGHMLAVMCRAFTKVNPAETLKLLVPHLCDRIHSLLGDGDELLLQMEAEQLDNELLYNLLILSEMLDCNGRALVPYVDELVRILDRTLHLNCRQGALMASKLLDFLLTSLTVIQPFEFRSQPELFCRPVGECLTVRQWGAPGTIRRLGIRWYQPGGDEIAAVQLLLDRYLPAEVQCLERYISGAGPPLTRDQLRRTLHIILAVLGAQTVLPMWKEPAIQLVPSKLEPWAFEMVIGTQQTVTMPDGQNVRQVLIDVMHRLQRKILQIAEDDTKSLFNLIAIWNTLLMNKFRLRDFQTHWKSFHITKKHLEDRLRGNKFHLRQILLDRVMLHQEFRSETRSCTFTETHRQIIVDLYTLSISQYSEVRIKAQQKLFSAVATFPYAYTVLTPLLKQSLQVDSNVHHEQFKGCLYVLLGPKMVPIISRHDWHFVNEIWTQLVTSKPSEKPSVISLMGAIVEIVYKNFPTISVKVQVHDGCLTAAKRLGQYCPTFGPPLVSEEEVQQGLETLAHITDRNIKMYNNILDTLLAAILTGNLHWRYHTMALSFIRDLVHPDVKYGGQLVKYVLRTLLHDSIQLRKLAIRVTVFILKQHKRPHKKVQVSPLSFSDGGGGGIATVSRPGCREDNRWMQYCRESLPADAHTWNEARFMHKQFHGYYAWPPLVEVYAPASEQPPTDRPRAQMTVQEQEILDFFTCQENVDTLVHFLAMEEKKDRDKFNGYRFIMFKNLFRNYGNALVPHFLGHLQELVLSKEENRQRAAAEIIAGIIRGSKHWRFEETAAMWTVVVPLLRTALGNMTVETVGDWGICFATATEGRDPNKHHWLYELLMEDPLRRDESSFIECGRLYTLQGALNQQVWRVSELFQRLFVYLQEFLTHPYQNVRERISSVLTNMFETDLLFTGADDSSVQTPRIAAFIDEVMPRLNILYGVAGGVKDVVAAAAAKDVEERTAEALQQVSLCGDEDKDVAIRLFKTVCKWITSSIGRSNFGARAEYYRLFPLACLLQSYEADEELSLNCSSFLAMLSQAFTLPAHIPQAICTIKRVAGSSSWSSRAAVAEYIQVFVFHNMALLLSRDEWVQEIKAIVLTLLEDDQPEVRQQASQVLGGFFHCQFVPFSHDLLDGFKRKARTRLRPHGNTSADEASQLKYKTAAIRKRHTGVLGMCAFINAHPYDVPEFVVDVFRVLGGNLNDPQPIPSAIRKTLGDFKRTHHDNWEVHQLQFSEDELAILSDLTVPPSYYA